LKALEPNGRFRDKRSSEEIMAEAQELADGADVRENTMFNRFIENLSTGPKGVSNFSPIDHVASSPVEVDRSILPEGVSEKSSYEDAMMVMSDLRDSFINVFPSVSSDKNLYGLFTESIHRVEAGMRKLGMEVDEFNPLTSLSGLSSSDEILVNAKEVVSNTVKRYNLHKISSIKAEVYKGAPSVVIVIEADDAGLKFEATGRIIAPNDFSGNEAIDFVTKGGDCALGVKAISLGKFIDVSDRFSIDFDLKNIEDPTPQ
jgi:hypothetical protein